MTIQVIWPPSLLYIRTWWQSLRVEVLLNETVVIIEFMRHNRMFTQKMVKVCRTFIYVCACIFNLEFRADETCCWLLLIESGTWTLDVRLLAIRLVPPCHVMLIEVFLVSRPLYQPKLYTRTFWYVGCLCNQRFESLDLLRLFSFFYIQHNWVSGICGFLQRASTKY